MTAKSEIEKKSNSLDPRFRPHYQKRSTSLIHHYFDNEVIDETAEMPVIVPNKRQKSVSVCLANLPTASQPRTLYQFERQNPAIRNAYPQTLSAYELTNVRIRGLSTSEVFNEPPGMYVYHERPITYPYVKRRSKWSLVDVVKRNKHRICAWTFGIIAITLVMTIIILQTTGSLG
ncbi:unnamed protein product [Auanema sp. JU1783]|nr:unnamed protein product [Auanema sp. JU1783]